MKQRAVEAAAGILIAAHLRQTTDAAVEEVRQALEAALRYHDDPGTVVTLEEAVDAAGEVRARVRYRVEEIIRVLELDLPED